MSDVRLTATNPEDSSVVPVACNAKGELLLEEPITPPEFDGYLDGDLTVTGIGTFAGAASVGSSLSFNTEGIRNDGQNSLVGYDASKVVSFYLKASGTAWFAGNVTAVGGASFLESTIIEPYNYLTAEDTSGQSSFIDSGFIRLRVPTDHSDPNIDAKYTAISVNDSEGTPTATIYGNGAAVFKSDVTVYSRTKQYMLVEQGGLCHMVEQTRSTTDLIDQGFSAPEYPNLRDVFKELDLIEEALNTVMEKLRLTPPAGWEVWDGSDNSH